MIKPAVPLSLLYSTTGAYAALGREAVAGAMTAISEINTDPASGFRLEPRMDDPGGHAETYGLLADAALRQKGCRHIVGTITSWSRKEVLPVVERQGALLWYAFPYEGYEASDSVLYLGACPNQHLLPLFDHVTPLHGRRPLIIGSNYIWGWEIGRIARELTEAAGGEVVAERFMPLGSEDVEHLITEIRQKKPDFILSNLVGKSAHALLRAYAALGARDPDFAPSRRPLVACNLSESDIAELAPAERAGHVTAAVYFDALDTPENALFKQKLAARHGLQRRITGPFAYAYMSVSILARCIAEAGTDDPDVIRRIVTGRQFSTPAGSIAIDPRTHHASLRAHLGRSNTEGGFDIIHSSPAAIEADPYLVRTHRSGGPSGQPLGLGLKVVK